VLRRPVLLTVLTLLLGACTPTVLAPVAPVATARPTWSAALRDRASAVLAHDLVGVAATTSPTAGPAVRDLGLRTRALPITEWTYQIQADQPGPAPNERAVTALLRYRLRADLSDVTSERRILLREAASPSMGWQVLSDDPAGAAQPWDLGVVSIRLAGSAVLLATPGPVAGPADRADPAGLAADAARAVTAVTGVWGPGWSQEAVVVATYGASNLARLVGRPTSGVSGLVAVSTPDRVYVDLSAYALLSPAGRQVLITHELTHVATRSGADPALPQWLKEGFADYVGFLGSGIGTRAAAAALLAQVRRTGPPAALPPDAAFDPSVSGAVTAGYSGGDAYAAAWVACSLVASKVGPAGLVRVYRAASAGRGSPSADVDAALRQVTGWSLARWTSVWRDQLTRLAG